MIPAKPLNCDTSTRTMVTLKLAGLSLLKLTPKIKINHRLKTKIFLSCQDYFLQID